jgi:putative nucleotidyltransferase with HDIG domain
VSLFTWKWKKRPSGEEAEEAPSASVALEEALTFDAGAHLGPAIERAPDPLPPPRPHIEEKDVPIGLCKLPFFRPVLMRLMRVLSQEEPNLVEVTKLIQSDAAFSTELLQLANCPLYGFASKIASISQAVMVLGFERTKTLAVAVGMKTALKGNVNSPVMRRCWQHSLATALIAEELAQHCDFPKDRAYTGGLIHDVGRLGLLAAYTSDYSALLEVAYESPGEIREAEKKLFNIDHAGSGWWLTRAWGFPEELWDVAAHHHDVGFRRQDPVSLIGLSCRVASAVGFRSVEYTAASSVEADVSRLASVDLVQLAARVDENVKSLA